MVQDSMKPLTDLKNNVEKTVSELALSILNARANEEAKSAAMKSQSGDNDIRCTIPLQP